jgi:hypothetical protein
VALNAGAREALAAWLTERRQRFPKPDEPALFLNPGGRRLSIRSIDLALRRLGEEADIAVSAHTLRHSCLTNLVLVRRGHDLVLVAEIAGLVPARLNADGTIGGLVLPPTSLVHHLVFARGNAQTRHRRHRQPPLPSSLSPVVGRRYFVVVRSAAFSDDGTLPDGHRHPAVGEAFDPPDGSGTKSLRSSFSHIEMESKSPPGRQPPRGVKFTGPY